MREERLSGVRKMLFLFGMVAASGALSAGQLKGSIVYPSGAVTVNGNQVTTTTAVFSGDRLQTGSEPTVLHSDGLTIRLFRRTKLIFGEELGLESGAIVVSAGRRVVVRTGGLAVIASSASTKLEVGNFSGVPRITTYRGTVDVNYENYSLRVRPGEVLTISADKNLKWSGAAHGGDGQARARRLWKEFLYNDRHREDDDYPDDGDHPCGWRGRHHHKCRPSPSSP